MRNHLYALADQPSSLAKRFVSGTHSTCWVWFCCGLNMNDKAPGEIWLTYISPESRPSALNQLHSFQFVWEDSTGFPQPQPGSPLLPLTPAGPWGPVFPGLPRLPWEPSRPSRPGAPGFPECQVFQVVHWRHCFLVAPDNTMKAMNAQNQTQNCTVCLFGESMKREAIVKKEVNILVLPLRMVSALMKPTKRSKKSLRVPSGKKYTSWLFTRNNLEAQRASWTRSIWI